MAEELQDREDRRLFCCGQRRSPLVAVCLPIIANELCERMAYYGIMASLTLFFTKQLDLGNALASTLTQLFSGLCYATALLGGIIADSYWGRYKTIVAFIFWYLIGMVGVAVAATGVQHGDRGSWEPMFYVALFGFVAVGTGGIKPNVSTLGADQYDLSDPQQKKGLDSFFNWFYWTINLGCIPAYTVIAYLCQTYNGGDFGIGYAIPAVCMLFSIIAFLSGSKKYKKLPPAGSTLGQVVACLWSALAWKRGEKLFDWNRAAERLERDESALSLADVKSFVSLVVPWGALMCLYWTVYAQMSGPFYIQGCQMNLHFGGHVVPSLTEHGSSWTGGFEIPIAALNLFDSFTILLCIPLCDKLLFPCLGSIIEWNTLQKIGTGFFFAALSMVAAAVTEHYRLHVFESCAGLGCTERLNGNVCQNDAGYDVANISVLWQIPQYAFIGISEVFTSIGAMEFFYSQAPAPMRSCSSALNLLTTAIGTWMAALLTQMVNADPDRQWITDDLNDGHFADFFLLVGALMLLALVVFVHCARSYIYREPLEEVNEGISFRTSMAPSACAFASFGASLHSRDKARLLLSKTMVDVQVDNADIGFLTNPRIKHAETL